MSVHIGPVDKAISFQCRWTPEIESHKNFRQIEREWGITVGGRGRSKRNYEPTVQQEVIGLETRQRSVL